MAKVVLTQHERQELIRIFFIYGNVNLSIQRQHFYDNSGLSDAVPELLITIPLEGDTQTFCHTLINALQRRGTLSKTQKPALLLIISYLRCIVVGNQNEEWFLDGLIEKFDLQAFIHIQSHKIPNNAKGATVNIVFGFMVLSLVFLALLISIYLLPTNMNNSYIPGTTSTFAVISTTTQSEISADVTAIKEIVATNTTFNSNPTQSNTIEIVPPVLSTFTPTNTPDISLYETNCNDIVDLGDPNSEIGNDLQGWYVGVIDEIRSPSGDTTFRYQSIGGYSTLKLCVARPNQNYLLVTEIQDFGCDDSFEIIINDILVYEYEADPNIDTINHYELRLDRSIIDETEVDIVFKNNASDNCGSAGVYNVGLVLDSP